MNNTNSSQKNDDSNFNENKESGLKKYTSKLMDKLTNSKLFKIKNVKLVGLVVLLTAVVVGYFFISKSSTKTTSASKATNSYYTSSLDYAKALESKMQNVLSNISGSGKVSVMVKLSSSLEIGYAESVDEKNNSSVSSNNSTSTKNTTSNTIIVKNNGVNSPLVVKEILPEIKGVVVVCEGAKDVNIKLKIVQAVKALLDIPSNNIQVFS